jgi:signal transduction histidine kinase
MSFFTFFDKKIFNSLFWKISALFLLILLALSLIYLQLFTSSAQLYFQETNQRLNAPVAEYIVKEISPFVEDKVNKPALELVFNGAMVLNPSIEVYLLDAKGKILAYSAPDTVIKLRQVPLAPIHTFIRKKGDDAGLIRGVDPRNIGVWKAFSAAPVREGKRVKGYIYIILAGQEYESTSQLVQKNYILRSRINVLIIAFSAALLVGLLLIWLLTRNLNYLIYVVRKFQQGDLQARIPVKSGDEISQLSMAFNEMAETLSRNIAHTESIEKSKRELIANVSHDLRTPLTIIHGYVETLLMKENLIGIKDRQQYLQTILQGTENLTKLVNELFELSKLESHQMQLNKEPFFIDELISDIVHKYQLVAERKGVKLEMVVNKKMLPVYADIGLMERVLHNLIDNAIKFTGEGGSVRIELKPEDKKIVVKVADTGVGIPKEEQPFIFDRYWKMNRGHITRQLGSGLGLAIVKRILELHGISIMVDSHLNQGTTFSFYISIYQS